MAKIYLASSWKNNDQPQILQRLIGEGHEVYDFRNPPCRNRGFSWSSIDVDWNTWSSGQYLSNLLYRPECSHGYLADLRGMEWADTCVLLLPCGRSAHLEAGYCKGRGKRLIIMLNNNFEPDLMYLMADHIVNHPHELTEVLGQR